MNIPLAEWKQRIVEIALEGGEVLKKHWGNVRQVQNKSVQGDLVTEADRASEELLIKNLKQDFPRHAILAEESGGNAEAAEFLWVVDPLDGTTNFAHQFPFVAISIGLLYRQKPILGVVYNPIMNELFSAAKGLGAFLNGSPIHVSTIRELKDSLLATGFSYDRRLTEDNNYAEFCQLTNMTHGVRRAGAASLDLSYVAAGRLDGYWEKGLKPWDIAAGMVLVEEAGGAVADYDLEPVQLDQGRILASNGFLQQKISSVLLQTKDKITWCC